MAKSNPLKKPNNSPEITARKRAQGKSLGGRPKFQIDYLQLEELCGMFCTEIECAAVLGCSTDTLTTRLKEDFKEELEKNPGEVPIGRYDGFSAAFKKMSSKGKVSLRREQFRMALGSFNKEGDVVMKPDKTMLIWLGKNHLDQTDRLDTTIKDNTVTPSGLDLSALSDKEFKALGALIAKARDLDPEKQKEYSKESDARGKVH